MFLVHGNDEDVISDCGNNAAGHDLTNLLIDLREDEPADIDSGDAIDFTAKMADELVPANPSDPDLIQLGRRFIQMVTAAKEIVVRESAA